MERERRADSGGRSRGVMKHEEEVLEKWELSHREGSYASGRTKNRCWIKSLGTERENKTHRAARLMKQGNSFYLHPPNNPLTVNPNQPKSNGQHSGFYSLKSASFTMAAIIPENKRPRCQAPEPSRSDTGSRMPKIHTALTSILGTESKRQIPADTSEAVFCSCKRFHCEPWRT